MNSLHDSFYEFIYKYSCGEGVAPKIAKMCEGHVSETVTEAKKTNAEALPNTNDMLRRYRQARRKFSKLHKDHQNLIGR